MALLALDFSSGGAMQEPSVQCWLQSAVPKLRCSVNCQQKQFKQYAMQQQQALLDVKASKLEADAANARAEQDALDLEQQLCDVTLQQEQPGSSSTAKS
ncbi:hypothetical protein WJX74_009272 [Apatococcus lobatus]|uniref:Uncharacterized protein n=1 Tax=Apatococcus lobatus TaxID=904363 RepID=A0AAW1R4X2_9CHLO